MQTEETRILHFSISGDFITQHARDRLREGSWRNAYNFVTDCLSGVDSQTVIDVLRGTKQFEGVNEFEVVDDDAQSEVQAWIDFQFRNCFLFKNKVYRPYGHVSAYCEDDWRLARKIHVNEDEAMVRNKMWGPAFKDLSEKPVTTHFNAWDHEDELALRPAYYADHRERDICFRVNLPEKGWTAVLAEEVDIEVPIWHRLTKAAGDCARNAFEVGALLDLAALRGVGQDNEAAPHETVAQPASNPQPASHTKENLEEQIEEEEARYAREDAALARTLDILKTQVAHFATNDQEYGWKELTTFDKVAGRNVTLKVPHRAFVCAALSRAKAHHLMPEYSPRCPSGLKMYNDCRYHSDAWLGAGMAADLAYDDTVPEQRLFMDQLYELQRELLSCSFDTLARGSSKQVYGQVIHDPALAHAEAILVVKSASPEYADAALKCKGVVVETGSKLAHLVVVSREESIPVIRVPNATERFLPGRKLSIDFDEGTVEIWGL